MQTSRCQNLPKKSIIQAVLRVWTHPRNSTCRGQGGLSCHPSLFGQPPGNSQPLVLRSLVGLEIFQNLRNSPFSLTRPYGTSASCLCPLHSLDASSGVTLAVQFFYFHDSAGQGHASVAALQVSYRGLSFVTKTLYPSFPIDLSFPCWTKHVFLSAHHHCPKRGNHVCTQDCLPSPGWANRIGKAVAGRWWGCS